ncbi:MAG TPA: YihY/virulence factor BrkB family protein [Balneolaceae bacterium]|nr:YihY/virulence factor BrkB family protein [Balneolaceae bacterium]
MQKLYATSKNLLKETFNNIIDDNIALHGAAIAFYTIFSAAPLIFIVVASAKFFLGNQQTQQALTQYLMQLTSKDIAHSLINMAATSNNQHANVLSSIFATILLVFGATTVVSQLKNSLNTIWDITEPNINSVLLYIINRIVSLVIVFVLMILMLCSLLLEAQRRLISSIFHSILPAFLNPILRVSPTILSVIVSVLFFTIIFKLLPDVHARWRDIFVGACVTTALFLGGKFLIGLYLNSSSLQASYKAAGSFIIFLIWIYYNVQTVLIGAEFTETYTRLYGAGIKTSWNSEIINWHSLFKA